jgi:hypothetical protein
VCPEHHDGAGRSCTPESWVIGTNALITFVVPRWGYLASVALLLVLAASVVAAQRPRLGVRPVPWPAAGVPQAAVTARYGASQGYVAYWYRHDAKARVVELEVTGSGDGCELRVLLPAGARRVAEATVDGRAVRVRLEKIEKSVYAVLKVAPAKPTAVGVKYVR